MGKLLDSSFLEGLSFLFDDLCTIQEQGVEAGTFGEESGGWVDVVGHVDIPCRVGTRAVTADRYERATGTQTYTDRKKVILLKGYFPEVTEKNRAVTAEGVWDIDLVNHDSEEVTTSLDVSRVE